MAKRATETFRIGNHVIADGAYHAVITILVRLVSASALPVDYLLSALCAYSNLPTCACFHVFAAERTFQSRIAFGTQRE